MAENINKPEVPVVVVDTNFFVSHPNVREFVLKNKVYTTRSVLKEIKDAKSRAIAKEVFHDLVLFTPHKMAVEWVNRYTVKSGDFSVLSQTDTEVIAVAVELIRNKGLVKKLNKVPKEAQNIVRERKNNIKLEAKDDPSLNEAEEVGQACESQDDDVNAVESKKQEENEDEVQEEVNAEDEEEKEHEEGDQLQKEPQQDETQEPELKSKKSKTTKLWQEGQDFSKNDEDGWITKENYKLLDNTKTESSEQAMDLGVSVITTDYAMQNSLLGMGIPLLSFDGRYISVIRRYILECYACQNVVKDLSKVFCPKCGYDTLLRVTCSHNADGSLTLYRKKNFEVRKRGKRYNIPNPKGGRVNNDLIFTEDQLDNPNVQKKLKKANKFREKQLARSELAYSHGWGFEDVTKHNRKFRDYEVGYGRKNPNCNTFQKKRNNRKL